MLNGSDKPRNSIAPSSMLHYEKCCGGDGSNFVQDVGMLCFSLYGFWVHLKGSSNYDYNARVLECLRLRGFICCIGWTCFVVVKCDKSARIYDVMYYCEVNLMNGEISSF